MTNKKKDARIWIRMGWELAALHQLATSALCEWEYQAVMSKKELGGLYSAIKGIDKTRNAADVKFSHQGILLFGPNPFYGLSLDPARDMANDFRGRLGTEAQTRSVKLYALEGEPNA